VLPLAAPRPQLLGVEAGTIVVAAALPFLLLHREYQPSISVGRVDAFLSDAAVAAILVTAGLSGRRRIGRLTGAWMAWLPWAALAALVMWGVAWGSLRFGAYPSGTHAVTAAKWLEYMLLAPALVLIADNARDLRIWAATLIAWSCVSTAVGLLQFVGALGNLDHTPAGSRKPSLLGDHDFAALSASSLALALFLIARGPRSPHERRWAWAAALAGSVGMVVAGAFDAFLGELLAAGLIVVVVRPGARRAALVGAVVIAVAAGLVAIRSQAVTDGLKFLGAGHHDTNAGVDIQSYRQRTLLAYIGLRIFRDHPALGVGWQGSGDAYAYEPYLADARRHFVQPARAFPSREHPWGVQNAYVQSLADLGFVGLFLFLGSLLVPAYAAVRRGVGDARIAAPALILVAAGAWNGYGLTAGVPLDALTWLSVGCAVLAFSLGDVRTDAR
jgi:hypothetical protein